MAVTKTTPGGHADGWTFASAASGIVNTTTAVTIAAAPTAPTRNYLTSLQVAHDTLGAATELAIRDGAGGAVLWRHKLQTAANENMTFNLPDLRGRVAAGKDDMGGSAANRITATTVPNSPQLGAAGGLQTNTATTTVSGSVTGTINVSGATSAPISGVGTSTPGPGAAADDNHVHNVTASGSANLAVGATGISSAFGIVQPTIILNKMIAI